MKLAIVALVLFAVSFAGVTALGGRSRSPGQPAWLEALRGRLVKTTIVRLREIDSPAGPAHPAGGSCFDGSGAFVLAPGRPCDVAIAASSRAPVRELRLTLVAGAKARVAVEPRGERGQAYTVTLEADGRPQAIQVFEDGADLTLACERSPAPGIPCRLERR